MLAEPADLAVTPLAIADRLAIEDRITTLFRRVDRLDPQPAADLFTADAMFDMGLEGVPVCHDRAGIAAVFAAVPKERMTRHAWSGLSITPHASGEVQAALQTVVFVGTGGVGKASHVCDVDATLRPDPATGAWYFSAMTRRVALALA